MNLIELGKGVLCIAGAIVYFKYFNTPLFSKEYEKQMNDEKYSENTIKAFKWTDKMTDVIAFICGLLLIVIGVVFIYNELARHYAWELILINN